MGLWQDIFGTTQNFFRVGLTGFRLKNNSGNLVVRNADDSADAEVTASKVNVSGDDLVLNSDAANTGSDRSITLKRPASGMGASYTLTLPTDDGSPNQVLGTDGNGNLSWVTAGGTADKLTIDTTTLAFGSSATVSMFTLPANAVVEYVETVVDIAFNGTPSMSVGISGSTSKYLAASQVDLKATAKTSFQNHPGEAANSSTENLEIAYTPGGATAGSARVLVAYAVPS